MNDSLLSRSQLAEMLGISRRTIESRKLRARLAIPELRVGRLARYRRSDVEAFLAGRQSVDLKTAA